MSATSASTGNEMLLTTMVEVEMTDSSRLRHVNGYDILKNFRLLTRLY